MNGSFAPQNAHSEGSFFLLPAFAESPVRKGGDECEKGIHRSLGEGGSASAGSAEEVKMPRAPVLRSSATAEGGAARGASLLGRIALGLVELFFLLFGIYLLILSYHLTDPFSFIMTFFASNLVILISAVLLLGLILKFRKKRKEDIDTGFPPSWE